VAAHQALKDALHTYTTQLALSTTILQDYSATLHAQNLHYFELQQRLTESEDNLVEEGERNRHLLGVVKEEYKLACDRVGTSALESVVNR